MAYNFLEEIKDIKASLGHQIDDANQEMEKMKARKAKLEAKLVVLEVQQFRANSLESVADDDCVSCVALHDIRSTLKPIPSDDGTDCFRCKNCGAYYP